MRRYIFAHTNRIFSQRAHECSAWESYWWIWALKTSNGVGYSHTYTNTRSHIVSLTRHCAACGVLMQMGLSNIILYGAEQSVQSVSYSVRCAHETMWEIFSYASHIGMFECTLRLRILCRNWHQIGSSANDCEYANRCWFLARRANQAK